MIPGTGATCARKIASSEQEKRITMAIGYYITCDDALCSRCYAIAGGLHGWNDRGGFEGWEEPIAIFDDTESDSPTHCCECGALIEHGLTDDGLRSIGEAVLTCFETGQQNPVTSMWLFAYSDALDGDHISTCFDVYTVMQLFARLPHDEKWREIEHCKKYALAAWGEARNPGEGSDDHQH